MIRRLLIANRGEIALRIVRACRELDIESIAVYSDADSRAPYVAAAHRAIRIGPAPPAGSYLNVEAILAAARETRAEAVHPAYGFLAERARFARACEDAGIIFVGPPAVALERMGSKIGARTLMEKAGVPVVPGEGPADQSDAGLEAALERVGLPALLKPAAGGGGIGMKTVRAAADVREAIQRARREALSAFGDGTLYVERVIERPRHVEFQIFADLHGACVHLFERECSIQRRHQKVIEESPCPVLTPELRRRMGEAAVAAARAVGYVNAGTVEFLLEGVGDSASFFFLEMNARLQVEHPVTEAVVGVDLVHAQLAVASGERLPWEQAHLTQRGHAIECRVYAENPAQGFLPQAGTLERYIEPRGPGVRVDSGVIEGSDVSVYYDPLLAKVIVSAETRNAAIARAKTALREFVVQGLETNIPFLVAILQHPRFASGDIDTTFLDTESEALRRITEEEGARTAAHGDMIRPADYVDIPIDPFVSLKDWRIAAQASVDVPPTRVKKVDRARSSSRARSGSHDLTAPMPATVIKVLVERGAAVKKGDTVVMLEAMKMELPVRAPRDGTVRAVLCRPGELVQAGTNLLELEA